MQYKKCHNRDTEDKYRDLIKFAREISKEITSAKQHSDILDKRSGNAMTENEIGSPRMDSFQRIPAPNPPLVSWFPPHRRAGFPRPAPLPSARGKFMANCFNRWYGTTWCTKYTRPCESGRSRVADFAKGEIVSSFSRVRRGWVKGRRKDHCFSTVILYDLRSRFSAY